MCGSLPAAGNVQARTSVLKVDSGANTRAMFLQGGGTKGQTKKDIVISNIFFTDGGTATINSGVCEILAGGGPGALTDVYLDMKDGGGCTDTLGAGGIQNLNIQPSTTNFFNIAIWGSTFSSPLTGTNCIGILGGAQQWYSIVGTSVTGNGNANPIRCHHIYVHAQRHVLVRWNRGGNSDPTGISPTRNYTIKTSYDNSEDGVPPGGFYAEYFLVSENRLHGTTFGLNISNKFNNPLATRFKYYVDQQDIYDHLPGKGAQKSSSPGRRKLLPCGTLAPAIQVTSGSHRMALGSRFSSPRRSTETRSTTKATRVSLCSRMFSGAAGRR